MSRLLLTSADGRTWWGCECLRDWWPWVTKLAVHRGLVARCLDVTQGCYSGGAVRASAGTHNGGGVLDLRQHGGQVDDLLEEMGAAAYERTPAQGFSYHTHLILIGCPHLDPSAEAQVRDWRARRDGLAYHRPDPDQTRPAIVRTWSQGIAWARTELPAIITPPTTLQEDDMAQIESISPQAASTIAAAIGGITFAGRKPALELLQLGGKLDAMIEAQRDTNNKLAALVAALTQKVGA